MDSTDIASAETRLQDRLRADVHRAVGGTLNLIRELSRISQNLDEAIAAEWMVKRVQFLSYELQSLIPDDATAAERLEAVNKFFFKQKRFQCINDPSKLREPSEAFRLSRVLADRAGAAKVLSLLYAFLAERVGVELSFVDLKPVCFLKWSDDGRSRFIDLTRSGATLSTEKVIETLHTRFKMTSYCNASLCEPYAFEAFLADYIGELKRVLGGKADPEHLLILQNVLISYKPSDLVLLGERALLHRRLGNFKSALADLKRYFSFHEKAKAPAELGQLHDELTTLLERNKTSIEVLD